MTTPRRLMFRLVTVFLAVAGLVAVGAPPATASHFRSLQYVALGDSYAAGQGAGRYLNSCKQTSRGYPALLDSRRHISLRANASCSGATTSDVIDTQVSASDVIDTQVSALNKRTRLVTLTVGANDLGVGSVAAACAAGPSAACTAAINHAVSLLTPPGNAGLLAGLVGVYTAVAAAAPRAEILVTGYPYLFENPPADSPAAAINTATTALNQTIEATVAAMPDGVNITYVDVTAAFAGHGIGSRHPFINTTGDDAYHPNGAGYRAYAAELRAALSPKPHK